MNNRSSTAIMIGESAPMRELRELIAIAGETCLPVFIQGETGSGKELVARAVHRTSGRAGNFVPINTCAIAESMFEGLLFGHVRGAFTGALSDRAGFLTEAHQGTIFLDEISGMLLAGQAKLLRAVETREYRPIGAQRDRFSDFRLISASNEPVESLVAKGQFRADLAFRLRGIEIHVPPLRERSEDIASLAQHFARESLPQLSPAALLSDEAVRRLETHSWPGNVRELRQTIARAVAFARGASVELEHIERASLGSMRAGTAVGRRDEHGQDGGGDHSFVRRRLLELMEQHHWDTIAAARDLDVTRKTIYARLKRLGISIPDRNQRRAARRDRPGSASADTPQIHGECTAIHSESGEWSAAHDRQPSAT